MEALRRLLLVLFTVAAITAWFAPAETLYLIEKPDFKDELENHHYPWKHKGKSVLQYIEKTTKDRVHLLSYEQWLKIASELESRQSRFIRSDNQKIKAITAYFSQQFRILYFLPEKDPLGYFISVRQLSPDDYSFEQAPYSYQYPYYLWSPVLLLAGLLFYIFLPRHQFSKDTLCYGTGFSTVIGPDFLGWMLMSSFYLLGLGVGLSGASGGILSLLSSELFIITCILWMFTLSGLYMLKTGAKYAGLGLKCSAKNVIRFSPVADEVIAFSKIDSVKLGHWKASKWLTRIGFFISLFNWRAMGPTLLNASRKDPLLEVHLKDGRVWKYDLIGADNVDTVLLCLQKYRVKIDTKLLKIIEK